MQPQRFRSLVRAQGPFASVYFDDTHDTADAVEQLEARWRDIHRHLVERGTPEDVIVTLEQAVLHHRPPVGRRGHAVIANHDEVLVNEHLVSPPSAPVVRWSEYPFVLPLAELELRRPTYVFAGVDHLGADITLHRGDVVSSETVDGGGYPVHKPVTAGWDGYGDFQRTTEEAARMNVRAVARRLTELVDDTGAEAVFVCGEVRSRTDVVSALPERVASRVSQLHAGARNSRIDDDQIRYLIDAEFAQRRQAEIADVSERFQAEIGRGSGLAAEGLTAVCAALRTGDVETLIVGDIGDATVVTGEALTTVAPDADALSELGEAMARVTRADEALPFAAISVGASVMRLTGIAAADGIGALLRYVPTGTTPRGDTRSVAS